MQVLVIIDMQNGVFATPRYQRAQIVSQINQLSAAAQRIIFIQHEGEGMSADSEDWQLLPELDRPEGSVFITKTACDAFYRTGLAEQLERSGCNHLIICGCATDYCVDATIKNAASRGYALTIVSDAHTTANRGELKAEQLIVHYNEVWRNLIIPGNTIYVKTTGEILTEWGAH
ncbi:isochorismatase [Brenneria roseae subsp. americana]|uniref:Isochorismatase n=1 Tax=Brenneria roseae subsp. americana TaxID=1508507 RepID=A0A2U1TXU4_9GAMM|nr:cysteine hydrolase family protein [Brenneria roseae]PWC14221.1 isochorismatase [Brenneria roseae subsp. americana]